MMRNYLITGASSGVGNAFARYIAADDVRQIVIGRNVEKLVQLSNELPGEVLPIAYDLSDVDDLESVFKPCIEGGFKLDGMVHCAGIDGTWPIKTNNHIKMNQIMTVNCYSFVELSRLFYSHKYSNDSSSIVAISSIASIKPEKGMLAYSMSKAALNIAVKTAAQEFIRRRIRVNAILPGGIATPMAAEKSAILGGLEKISGDENNSPQPLGSITSHEVAKMINYLLSDDARHMTGELIVMSGGRVY